MRLSLLRVILKKRITMRNHVFIAVSLLTAATSCFSQHVYAGKEKLIEESRIAKDIESKLDWRNRTKETQDDYDDEHRLLYGTLNESILLRQSTRERFGVFESIRENGKKSIEIRLHTKNKLTDRFFLFGDACERASIFAEKVTSKFVLYQIGCYAMTKQNTVNEKYDQYLFDYSSRNFYRLTFLDYDPQENNAPKISLEKGVYKMTWTVKLRGIGKNTSVVRNFKIIKDSTGEWTAKELPPVDAESASVTTLRKLTLMPEYDLPAFVADWGVR
jgi:hypothetical protein